MLPSQKQPTPARRFKNYLQNPRFQLRYGLYFLGFGFFSMIAAEWVAYNKFREILVHGFMNKVSSEEMLASFDPLILVDSWEFFLFLVGYAALCFVFAIFVTHRIVGPIVAIRRFIEQLKSGNYQAVLRLRTHDELQEVADLLNEFASHMQNVSADNVRPFRMIKKIS